MHARQTSKKVKAALKARRMNGAHISSFAPLGYRWDPEQKGHLLVDPETKWIVEKIFDMAVHGMGAAKIMKSLIREKVPTPGYIHYVREGAYAHIYQNGPEKAQYAWNETKIRLILTDENYLGNSIHNKTSVKSFKLKKQTRNPASEWVRVEGTHEAIISKDVFDRVQKQIVSRRRREPTRLFLLRYLQQKGGRVYYALYQLQYAVRLCSGTAAILGIHGSEG